MEKRLRAGQFTFDDFLQAQRMMRKMGPLKSVLGMIPGLGKQMQGVERGRPRARARRGDRPLDDPGRARPARDHQRLAARPDRARAAAPPSSRSTASWPRASRCRR